jgi:simple sugar transport system permease protein
MKSGKALLMKRFKIPEFSIRPFVRSGVGVLLGLFFGALLMVIFGYDPIIAYYWLFRGAYGSISDIMETLAFATPLMLTAVTFAIGVKTGLFNIGAEGQMYLGAIGAAAAGGAITLPAGLHVAVATAFGMFLGALWSVPAALLKMWRGVHEVISTIMFNWIAFHFATYLIVYYLADPGRAERTIPTLPAARYPVLMEGSSLTAVVFVVVAFCIGIYIYLWGTKAGYELRLVGVNPEAASYAGVSSRRVTLLSFVIGGLAAGLAGASQIIGRPPAWSLYATLGNVITLGFDGIGVALIGRNHPIGGIFAAVFYGGLRHGSRLMEYRAGVFSELVRAINGLIVVALAIPEIVDIIQRRLEK